MRKYNKSILEGLESELKIRSKFEKKTENNSSDRKCFQRIRNTLKWKSSTENTIIEIMRSRSQIDSDDEELKLLTSTPYLPVATKLRSRKTYRTFAPKKRFTNDSVKEDVESK